MMSACDSMAALNFHNSLEVILCQLMIFLEQTFKLKKNTVKFSTFWQLQRLHINGFLSIGYIFSNRF